ncbi:hypothetical protein PoB_004512700 [Plakobranchus ocellatus]|uniref:Uncharacterized protein n=1 Tax=Plakobranchus ocellatus TaxID=259542 RepID=A0AAV4BGW2_9GAST|nr:hypothetical protein PoB_004512700 [Plakobranchus ocellatus]
MLTRSACGKYLPTEATSPCRRHASLVEGIYLGRQYLPDANTQRMWKVFTYGGNISLPPTCIACGKNLPTEAIYPCRRHAALVAGIYLEREYLPLANTHRLRQVFT